VRLRGALGKLLQASWWSTPSISRRRQIQSGKLVAPIYYSSLLNSIRALAFARIECHFFVNGGWMRDGQLIEEAHKIKHLPIIIVQGRYDVVCPAKTSWDLYQALGGKDNKNVEYIIIEDVGHSAREKKVELALVDAADKFKSLKA
jgi:proline iminopeptidase